MCVFIWLNIYSKSLRVSVTARPGGGHGIRKPQLQGDARFPQRTFPWPRSRFYFTQRHHHCLLPAGYRETSVCLCVFATWGHKSRTLMPSRSKVSTAFPSRPSLWTLLNCFQSSQFPNSWCTCPRPGPGLVSPPVPHCLSLPLPHWDPGGSAPGSPASQLQFHQLCHLRSIGVHHPS